MLGERYRIGQMIGRGGMAEVYEGHDLRLDRRVAVKILRPDLAQDPTFHQRFRREAHAAASLNHPNIVAVYDTGEDVLEDARGPVPFIVMEYVDGMTLRQLMSSGRRLLPERALEITSGTLAALDYSHRHGIVHRDIKPANVMLTPSGDVKVMDFGIARALAAEGQTMTATSAVMGTAQYLSPEQARGETVDARSDLYSTGCLLYELLTGRPPFIGESPVSVAYQHVSEQPAPPSQIDPAVPEPIDAVVMKALAKDVDVRYQTANEFRQDIERVLQGAPVTASTRVVAAAGAGALGLDAASTQQMSATAMAPSVPIQPEKKKPSPWVWVGIVAAILLLGGGAIALGSSLFSGSSTTSVTVPNLRGLTVAQAQSQLEGQGLRLGRTEPEASDEPSGTILQQDPAAGEALQQGQAVDVTVSAGREEAIVPNLVGLTSSDAASRALGEVELQLGTVTPRDSDQPEGFVLDQNPVQGTAVEKNTRVNIVVSSGVVEVPDLVGSTEAQARSDISNAGLQVSVVQQESSQTAGTVLAQSPRAGDRARKGTLVTITVAIPAPTPTPTPTAATPSPPAVPDTDNQNVAPEDPAAAPGSAP
jgi:serine/threonine-protein kinase